MAARPTGALSVLLKGTGELVGYFTGPLPPNEHVLRWSAPDDPDFGIEAVILREPDNDDPLQSTPRAIMVALKESLTGVLGFVPLNRTAADVPEIDKWRAAKLLIDRHGDAAAIEAAQRADEMLASGDLEGRAIWLAILHAVGALQQDRPESNERLN